jgi:hypothetical protein
MIDPEIFNELKAVDSKVDALSVSAARSDERMLALIAAVDEIKTGLNARRARERQERREDRRLLIGAIITVTVAIMGAVVTLLASGAFG